MTSCVLEHFHAHYLTSEKALKVFTFLQTIIEAAADKTLFNSNFISVFCAWITERPIKFYSLKYYSKIYSRHLLWRQCLNDLNLLVSLCSVFTWTVKYSEYIFYNIISEQNILRSMLIAFTFKITSLTQWMFVGMLVALSEQ